jgi:hypothetical protein
MDSEVTGKFVYLRFHGLNGGSAHDYADHELEPRAEQLRRCAREGLTGFVYFNNDVNTRAPQNALRLMQMVGKYAQRPKADAKGRADSGESGRCSWPRPVGHPSNALRHPLLFRRNPLICLAYFD